MKQHRIEVRRVGSDLRMPTKWELFVDGQYAGHGPESSRELIEEMAMLHTMVAAAPNVPPPGQSWPEILDG